MGADTSQPGQAAAEVLQVIAAASRDLKQSLSAIAEKAARHCRAYDAVLTLRQSDMLMVAAHHGPIPVSFGRWPLNRQWTAGRAVIDGVAIHVRDLTKAGADYPDGARMAREMGHRTTLSVPLVSHGRSMGAFTVRRLAVDPFTDEQISLLVDFADHAAIAVENAQLIEQTEARNRELAATSELLGVISRSPTDAQPVFDMIAKSAVLLCGAENSYVHRFDGSFIHLAAQYGLPSEAAESTRRNFPMRADRGSAGSRAIVTGTVVQIPDYQADLEYRYKETARLSDTRSAVAVPMLRQGVPIGAIVLDRKERGYFSDQQIELLKTFADQAVIAIENARLFEEVQARNSELKESLEQQTATSEILRVIASSPTNVQPVLSAVAESAAKLCEAYDAVIVLRNGDQLSNAGHYGPIPVTTEVWGVDESYVSSRVIRDGEPVHVHDIEEVKDEYPHAYARAKKLGQRAMLGVPLLKDGIAIGAVLIRRMEPRPFTKKQCELLTTFADQAVIAIENVRLFEEEQARNRELAATSDVLRVIASSPTDVQPVLDAVAESAARLCDAFDALVALREGEWLTFYGHYGPLPHVIDTLPLDRNSVTSLAVLDQAQIQIDDVTLESDRLPESYEVAVREGHRTIVAVPLMREGRAIGALVLRRREVRRFTEKQIDLLTTFADQAVIAIQNVRLFEEVQTRNRQLIESLDQQTAIGEILRAIAGSPTDVKPVLDAVVESACKLCQAYDAVIFLEDGGELALRAHHGSIVIDFERRHIGEDWVTGRAYLDRAPVHVHDLRGSADEFPFSREDALRQGHRTILAIPLLREGKPIGAMAIRRMEVLPFTQKQIELLTTFADQAVIAIENTRLFAEVQARNREITEALQQQTATSEVLQVISRSAFDLQTVLDTLVGSAARLCEADRAVIFRRLEDGYRIAATHGTTPEFKAYMDEHPILPNRESVTGRAILAGKPVQIEDVLTDPEYQLQGAQALGGWRAVLGVPLMREGSAIGVIALLHTTPRPFTARQVELMTTFADQAVIAIENVRLFEEVQARTRELSQSLQQQTATAEVLKTISQSAFDLPAVLHELADSAAKLCGANHGGILLQEGDQLRYGAEVGANSSSQDFLKSRPIARDRTTVSGRVALSGQIEHIPDLDLDPDYDPEQRRQLTDSATMLGLPSRAMMGVPLLRDGRVEGAFFLSKQQPGAFTDRQAELVQTFADQAVIAIQNARLFEEVQARTRQLTASLEYQTATSEVLSVISRSPTELVPVLDAIVETAARLCGADKATIRRRQSDSNLFATVASFGFTPEQAEYSRRHPFVAGPGSVAGQVAVTLRTVHVPDIHADPAYTQLEFAKQAGYQSVLSVPLLREGELIGILTLLHSDARPFSREAIERAETFADQAVIAIENTRLFEEVQARTRELQESLDHQTATSELLEVIGRSTTDLQPVFDTLAESAVRLCEAERAFVFRFDGEVLRAAAWHGTSPELVAMITAQPVRLGRQTIAARAGSERKTVHVHDVQSDPEYTYFTKDVDPIRTVLAVPMLRGDELLGVTVIYRREVRPFSSGQVALMETFSDQAVIAIENARLFEEVQARTRELTESLEQQTATANVLQSISRSTFDLDLVLKTLVESAARLCDTGPAQIWRRDGDVFRCAAGQVQNPAYQAIEEKNIVRAGRGTIVGRAALDKRPVQILDMWEDPEYEAKDDMRMANLRTSLGIPLMRGGEVIGVFALARKHVEPFSDRQVSLVTTFADQAVIAIENARLIEQLQNRTNDLARSVGELKALSEVGQTISSTLDVQAVLSAILTHACHLASSGSGAIYTYDQTRKLFDLEAGHNMSDELIAQIRAQPVAIGDALVGECAIQRQPIQIEDLAHGPSHPIYDLHLQAGVRALLALPLIHRDEIVGALVVRRSQTGAFSPEIVNLLRTFATQSAIAIHNARLFREMEDKSHLLAVASRHKSQFLANMSHELRTPLNSVLGFAEMLADGLYGELPEKAKVTLGRIQANGKHLLGLINDVLDLSKIEAGQLTLAIEEYSIGQIVKAVVATTEPLARTKGLKLTASVADGLPLGRGDERRISQVLLNLAGNAVKFTDRGSIDIMAMTREGHFEILVRDTGPGIAPEHQQRIFEEFQQIDGSSTRQKGGTGLGLAISKRIVELHGGRIDLDSTVGSGSTFRVRLPVRAEKAVQPS